MDGGKHSAFRQKISTRVLCFSMNKLPTSEHDGTLFRSCATLASTMRRIGGLGLKAMLLVLALLVSTHGVMVAQTSAPRTTEVRDRLRKAAEYLKANDANSAAKELNAVLALDPKNAEAYANLGVIAFVERDYQNAAKYLRKALAIDPNHQKALSNLGLVLAAQGRFDESFEAFCKVVGPAAAHSNVGVLMAKQGRYDQARQAFHRALAIDATLQQPKAFLAYLDGQPKGR